ncbi:ADP-ribosylglycohydrolase [Aphanothece sacrum FPU1]|uniref:ADP-ribosylglycohydrolase n=2 Tax=Aphanothece sacrum TaxID=1122 RepID=A0A401IDT1_APHSA|nr:ADP-ribosylglycohydrolase [Aphanothece sacrum FPU1]GBF86627.1 ADP-ribosylglycohydrolase [Aphanothece sacrum FPU3]
MQQKITARLIERGELSQEDWQMIIPSESGKNKSLPTGELTLGILPLIVFLFDTPYLLREQLQPLINLEQLSSQKIEDMLLWSELLGQLLSVKSLANSTDNQPWQQINVFLAQGTPLMEVKTYFKQQVTPEQFKMLLSVYCFRNNPEDFRLGVLRATQTGDAVITALTGALAGAYNGIKGIPLHWRLGISDPDKGASMQEQVKQLWAKWAGVYSPEQVHQEWETHEITSALIGQKYPTKRLISQKEYLRLSAIALDKH